MKTLCFLLLLLAGVISFTYGFAGAEDSCDVTCEKMKELIRKENVVSVYAIGVGPSGFSSGTAIVVLYEGKRFFVTNNHIVGPALKAWIKSDKCGPFMYEVEKVGRDPAIDLALLTVPQECFGITPASFAASFQVGERAYAVGYPFSVRTVTEGRINALESRSWLYLVTQAPLNPGNSGGPLFNEKEELVGVNTAVVSGGNVFGFTLSAQHIKRVLPRLTREKLVQHAAAGFSLANLSRVLPYFFEQFGVSYPPSEDKVVVAGVQRNSPADQAGLQNFDIVEKFNGAPVTDAKELEMKIFFEQKPGDEVTFVFRRGANVFERKLRLAEYVSVFSQNQEGDNNK